MAGRNGGRVEPLLISQADFPPFLDAHAGLAAEGLATVAEDNDAMRVSYLMIDPVGRVFGNAQGFHWYSEPVLAVGVEAALGQVGVSYERSLYRGGRYAW